MLNQLSAGNELTDGTVIYTMRQTAGRGQVGNSWEAEEDKNISFSMLLRPTFLPIREQFRISEITCLAIAETLEDYGMKEVTIKWPNDIYVGDKKICGMLIENSLMGNIMQYCVIGVGININQEHWIGNAPNPTSMKLELQEEYIPEEILDHVTERLWKYYNMLQFGLSDMIHQKYISSLYHRDGNYEYIDMATDQHFKAKIKTIEPSGYLQLEDTEGTIHRYMFKEVKFVLPGGIIKE